MTRLEKIEDALLLSNLIYIGLVETYRIAVWPSRREERVVRGIQVPCRERKMEMKQEVT